MDSYTFSNRFTFDNKKAKSGLAVKAAVVLLLLLLVLKTGMHGVEFTTIFLIFFCITLVLPRGAKTFDEYVSTRFAYENGYIHITYMNLDRHDTLGHRTEDYMIDPATIKELRYNEKESGILIVSQGVVTITSAQGEVIKNDYRVEGGYCENRLYLTDDVKGPILNLMQNIANSQPHLNRE